jgi:hypothetical protein
LEELRQYLSEHAVAPFGLVFGLLSIAVLLGVREWQGRRRLRARLAEAHSELSDLRHRDSLTGLVTREALEHELARRIGFDFGRRERPAAIGAVVKVNAQKRRVGSDKGFANATRVKIEIHVGLRNDILPAMILKILWRRHIASP